MSRCAAKEGMGCEEVGGSASSNPDGPHLRDVGNNDVHPAISTAFGPERCQVRSEAHVLIAGAGPRGPWPAQDHVGARAAARVQPEVAWPAQSFYLVKFGHLLFKVIDRAG